MFDQIFERSDALRRQLGGPLREERLAYLHHRAEQGAPRSTLRKLAQYLLVITERLNLRHHGTVTIAQIERAADQWARRHAGVRIDFSRPGKPTDNAYVESFNGTLRTECLDAHWFGSLTEAKEIIEAWRRDITRVVLTGLTESGRPTKSLVNSRLAANSQAPKLPETHSRDDAEKGDRAGGSPRVILFGF